MGDGIVSLFSAKTYTAPCDGFIYMYANPKTTSTEAIIVTGGSYSPIQCRAISGNPNTTVGLVKKGNKLTISYTTNLESSSVCYFVPLH